MKATLEELLEEKHLAEPKPPESEKGRCELIKDEGVLYWDGVRIDTFSDTEFQLLSMLWGHREQAHDVDRFLADCTVKFGWSLHTRRSNFDRHKSKISEKIRETGYETPIKVENGKVRAWPSPLKKKKKLRPIVRKTWVLRKKIAAIINSSVNRHDGEIDGETNAVGPTLTHSPPRNSTRAAGRSPAGM